MPAWEYELFMKEINNAVKEENERNQAEMDKSDYNNISKMADSKYIERQQRSMENSAYKKIPNIPNIGSFKMPKLLYATSYR